MGWSLAQRDDVAHIHYVTNIVQLVEAQPCLSGVFICLCVFGVLGNYTKISVTYNNPTLRNE